MEEEGKEDGNEEVAKQEEEEEEGEEGGNRCLHPLHPVRPSLIVGTRQVVFRSNTSSVLYCKYNNTMTHLYS